MAQKTRWLALPVGILASIAIATQAMASGSVVFDRGLPTANMNAAEPNRSNLSVSGLGTTMYGDDFVIGSVGESWIVTQVTAWTVGLSTTEELGDEFDSVGLYLTRADLDMPLSPTVAGTLVPSSSADSNPDIAHARATYEGGIGYESIVGNLPRQLWRHEFRNLSYAVDGGAKYAFAMDGHPHPGVTAFWFNHGSVAALSGSQQDGVDGRVRGWLKATGVGYLTTVQVVHGDPATGIDINARVQAVQVATDLRLCQGNG